MIAGVRIARGFDSTAAARGRALAELQGPSGKMFVALDQVIEPRIRTNLIESATEALPAELLSI